MTNTNGQEWLRLHTWAVAGDVLNEAKYAHTIAETLQKEGYEVALINPRSRDPRLCRSLSDYGQPIDVLDLVIHPKLGWAVQTKETGRRGEEAAWRYLRRHGYRLVTTNYACRGGEIDIIAKDKGTLVFVEVRSRSNAR